MPSLRIAAHEIVARALANDKGVDMAKAGEVMAFLGSYPMTRSTRGASAEIWARAKELRAEMRR